MDTKLKLYICNAFSLSMLNRNTQTGRNKLENPRIPRPVSPALLSEYIALIKAGKAEAESAVGHADTAALFSQILGIPVAFNRISVKLSGYRERALVGQITGGRLPEGSTTLPDGVEIEWWVV